MAGIPNMSDGGAGAPRLLVGLNLVTLMSLPAWSAAPKGEPAEVLAGVKAAGYEAKIGQFPFQANGRAMTRHGEAGFVRVVADARNDLVLGIQAVGQGVSELSAAFGLAVEMGATLQDVAGTIHAHPTLGEAFPEAAMKALGHALHI